VLRQCDCLKGIAKELGAGDVTLGAKLEALVLDASELRTKFQATTVAAGKQERRQLSRHGGSACSMLSFPAARGARRGVARRRRWRPAEEGKRWTQEAAQR